MLVTSKHLESQDPDVVPVHFSNEEEGNRSQDEGIAICKLSRGQTIHLSALARLGTGKEHAKWSAVSTVCYAFDPDIRLNQARLEDMSTKEKQQLVDSCPTKVFELDERTQQVAVRDRMQCMFCDECVNVGSQMKKKPEDENVVTVSQDTDRFIFTVRE